MSAQFSSVQLRRSVSALTQHMLFETYCGLCIINRSSLLFTLVSQTDVVKHCSEKITHVNNINMFWFNKKVKSTT